MMKLKYIGNDATCLVPGKIYDCSVSIEDYSIYLICDENIECGENITIGRLYTNVESFLKNWERVSNV